MSLALAAFAAGLFQAAVSREFGLIFSEAWLPVVTIFFAGYLCLGLGSYLAGRTRAARLRKAAAASGGLTLACLAALLALSPSQLAWPRLSLAAAAVVSAMTAFGFWFGAAMLREARKDSPKLGRASAAAALGYGFGFLCGAAAIEAFGAGALLLVLGTALLLAWPLGWRAGLAAALLALPGLDARLEALRPTRIALNFSNPYAIKRLKTFEGLRHWSLWSPYAKLDIYRHAPTGFVVGAVNHRAIWNWTPMKADYPGFSFIRPGDRVALIGASAGKQANAMPADFPLSSLTFVEIDSAVVGFFREHPEFNDRAFERSPTVAADGRAFLARLKGKLDVLIVGSLDSTAVGPFRYWAPASSMYTREGVRAAAAAIKPDGVLLYIPRDVRFAQSLVKSAAEAGLGAWIFYKPVSFTQDFSGETLNNGEYGVLMSRNQTRLEAAVGKIRAKSAAQRRAFLMTPPKDRPEDPGFFLDVDSGSRLVGEWLAMDFGALTDDRPSLAGHDPVLLPALRFCAGLALALLAACGVLCLGRGGTGGSWNAYFLMTGCGSMALELGLLASWRSCFGDPGSTAGVVIAILFAGQAAGALLADRLSREFSERKLPALFLVSALYCAWGLGCIPFSGSSAWALVQAAALLAPPAFVIGLFFPLGLRFSPPAELGWNLFLDGAGAAFGYAAFFLASQAWGIRWAILASGVCYAWAAFLIIDPSCAPASRPSSASFRSKQR